MKLMVKKTRPESTYWDVDKIFCDCCKKEYKIETGSYRTHKCTVVMEEATNFPECGESEFTEFDICPRCFAEKLIPWFESFGAEPRIRNTDY